MSFHQCLGFQLKPGVWQLGRAVDNSRRRVPRIQRAALVVRAVLEKPNNVNSFKPSGDFRHQSDLTAVREALNALFSRGHFGALTGTQFAVDDSLTDLEIDGSDIEMELDRVFRALRQKEQELTRLEAALVAGQKSLEASRKELSQREAAMADAMIVQNKRKREAEEVKNLISRQSKQLEKVRGELNSRVDQLELAREAMTAKEEEVRMAHTAIREKNERLLKADVAVKAKDRELESAVRALESERRSLAELLQVGQVREGEIRDWKQRLVAKEQQLAATTRDLNQREQMLRGMEAELDYLRGQTDAAAQNKAEMAEELRGLSKLLGEVQGELDKSRKALARSQREVTQLRAEVSKKDKQLVEQRALLHAREAQLEAQIEELDRLRSDLKTEKSKVLELDAQLQNEVKKRQPMERELKELRAKVRTAELERADARREVRERERDLSDARLALQLKEAEMVAMKLEMQDLQHELMLSEQNVKGKGQDLVEAGRVVDGLRSDLSSVRMQLRHREEQVKELEAELERKDASVGELKEDLGLGIARLADAEAVVRQVADLSRTLAASAREVTFVAPEAAADSLLLQTNEQLYSARQLLVLRELELEIMQKERAKEGTTVEELKKDLTTVKALLIVREAELMEVLQEVEEKERTILRLEAGWEDGEGELRRMREEVIRGARELQLWKERMVLLASGEGATEGVGGDKDDEEAGVREAGLKAAQLQVEVIREEVSAAMTALKGLSCLSARLRDDAQGQQEVIDRVWTQSPVTAEEGALFGTSLLNMPVPQLQRRTSLPTGTFHPNLELVEEVAKPTSLEDIRLVELSEELAAKENDFSALSKAMQGLSKLTRQLAVDSST